jgi:asparagine synthase (glutamine-hydrolysing)
MCGIIGIFNSRDIKKKLSCGMKAMRYRGRDGAGMYVNSKGGIGHLLHSVVGNVSQPLANKFVANCEIYNWLELCKKYSVSAENDADAMLKLIEKKGIKIVEEFDGVFAFALWNKGKVVLARDIIGEKPLWFSFSIFDGFFAFASEKKALLKAGFGNAEELNPRKILVYDIKKRRVLFKERNFLSHFHVESGADEIKNALREKFVSAVRKRIAGKKMGVLFSGGVDSSAVAVVLKSLGVNFTCYTAVLDSGAEDLEWAEKSARALGFRLKAVKVGLENVEKYLKKVVPLIEDSSVVKAGVALPLFIACEEAKKDGVKVVFSGAGSDEIFGGYSRLDFGSLNEDCFYRLKQMHHTDLYRDDLVAMFNSVELRNPFLDRELVKYALGIPAEYKTRGGVKKFILRQAVSELGLGDFAFRKKKAAQYGSRFDKAIEKLAGREGKSKSSYLKKFYPFPNMRLGVLFSSGKDSSYAAMTMQSMNYELGCLITMKSRNPDSYMFHTPNIDISRLQAEAMGIPLLAFSTAGEKEKELKDLERALKTAKRKYGIDGIVTGALFSTYQRNRIESLCDKVCLKCFSPLWHKNQDAEMREIIGGGFEIVFSSVAAEGLDRSWLGRVITNDDLVRLSELGRKHGFNTAGEGGEFESLVLDCPLFKKKKIKIIEAEIIMESRNAGRYIVKKAVLEEKREDEP